MTRIPPMPPNRSRLPDRATGIERLQPDGSWAEASNLDAAAQQPGVRPTKARATRVHEGADREAVSERTERKSP
jgi:hypothetical protein